MRLVGGVTRLLMLAFPRAFRRRYGADICRNARDLAHDAFREDGLHAVALLLGRLTFDLLRGGLAERRHALVPSPRPTPMLDTLLNDLRFAYRSMRARPGLTWLAVVTLTLGIGASVSMFSILDGVLLRDLPYPDSDRLMSVYTTIPEWRDDPTLGGSWNRARWSYDEYREWKARQESFTRASVHAATTANIVSPAGAEQIRLGLAGVDLLPMLGAAPVKGRLFSPRDREEAAAVAVVSHDFWRDRLGSDDAAMGRALEIDGEPFTVIGVLPDGFEFGSASTAVWLPIYETRPFGYFPGNTGDMEHLLEVAGLLSPATTPAQATGEIDRLLPAINGADHLTAHGGAVVPRLEILTAGVRAPLLILMGAVSLMLLVACANVATFLLSQAVDRRREIAVRSALGADGRRIGLQLLTESLMLALVGGLGGLLLAAQGVRALTLLAPRDLPRLADVSLDHRAFAFALAASTFAGLLFGLAPALTVTRAQLAQTFGATRFGSRGGRRLQQALIVAEVALATVLLVGAGLLVRSFLELNAVDPGFRTENILRVNTSPDTSAFFDSEGEFQAAAMDAHMTGVQTRLAALPGVRGVAVAQVVPFTGGAANNNVTGEGYDGADGWQTIASRRFVDPAYHELLDIHLVDGRFLTPADDRPEAASVVLVSRSLARRFWPDGQAVGKALNWWGQDSEVVGVVADIRERSLDTEPLLTFYAPRRRWSTLGGDYLVRVESEPSELVSAVRNALAASYPDLVVVGIEPITELVAESLAEARYRTRLIAVFAAMAAVLALLGLYAVSARSAAARKREIGIRVALGARPGRVTSLLLREGLGLASLGAGIGLVLAIAGSRVLSGLLYGVSPNDPLTLAAISLSVAAMAVVASLVPALRATRLDPVRVLRNE